MKKQYLETGKIVGTHGVRGMVRIQPWCNDFEFLRNVKKFYLDKNGANSITVTDIRPNGNVIIAKLAGVDTIESAEKFRNHIIYIDRDDTVIEDGSYFIQDIIGCTVLNYENDEIIGEISDVSETGANDVWHIKSNKKEYLIPVIDDVVKKVDIDAQKVFIFKMKGLFDDEN